MKAIQDLFSTDYGIASFAVIAVSIVGLAWAYVVLRSKMDESERNARK